jgi:hypothetical protein
VDAISEKLGKKVALNLVPLEVFGMDLVDVVFVFVVFVVVVVVCCLLFVCLFPRPDCTNAAASFGFPGAKELADMFGWFNDYGVWGPDANPFDGREIDPSLRNFKEFLVHSDFHV